MNQTINKYKNGSVNIWMITAIVVTVLLVGMAVLAAWFYVNYDEQKTNVNGKITIAVTDAQKAQKIADEAKFTQREKEPNREFVGPDDYGRITFNYPKTWSMYIDSDAVSGGTYTAYLNPIFVPPVVSGQRFALSVTILEKSYDSVIQSYSSFVKKGSLVASSVTVDGSNGTRLDGNFTKDIRGSAVIYKIRDKTVVIRTDVSTFLDDFNKLITTIKFNQ